jgi:adenylate cyclase
MPEAKHKLAAIMFTDIVGYTSLMGKDEDEAFRLLRTNREIQRSIIKKYHGEWIKEMGDGILASFDTASEAVRSAIEIQQVAKSEGINLRIGIHQGEVVFDGNDVLGDGVNVASRLEASADTGSINVSEAVFRDVKNKAGISSDLLGNKSFKNIDDDIKVYQVYASEEEKGEKKSTASQTQPKVTRFKPVYAIGGLIIVIIAMFGWYNWTEQSIHPLSTPALTAMESSIAVLPFANMSGDAAQEAMCDGLTEEIIHHLSIINLFDKVISRNSVMTFKESDETTPEIANMLAVNFVLIGSYRQSGNRMRITAQLVEASTDNQVWSEIYERPMGDIFDIQSDIAKNITSNLKGQLSSKANEQINISRTNNVRAFELYHLGRFYWNKRTEEGYLKSIVYFEQSIADDPAYGLAYAGLADTYNIMALQGHIDRKEGRDKAVDLAKKALRLDDQLAEAHTVLASIYTYVDRNWDAAEQEYLKAIEINPNYPTVHHYYSEHLSITGRHEAAREHINKAIELDPLSFVIRFVSSKLYFHRGVFQNALLENQRCLELNQNLDHRWIADLDYRINRELGNELPTLDGFKRLYGNFYGYYGLMEPDEIDSIFEVAGLDGILTRRIELSDHPFEKAQLYGILGDDEKAMNWLEVSVNFGVSGPEFPFYYEFRNLYTNPRYQALLDPIGLTEFYLTHPPD